MAVIPSAVRYFIAAAVLVGTPALVTWSLVGLFRRSDSGNEPPPLLVTQRALKLLAQREMSAEEHDRLQGLVRSLSLKTRIQARLGFGVGHVAWTAWWLGWGVAAVFLLPGSVVLLFTALSAVVAFLPIGWSRATGANGL